MTRPLRIQFEGATYHVFNRGNKDEHIFLNDQDKDSFIQWLGKGAVKYMVDVYAYCVMGSHYHLLIKTKKGNLSEFMHFLGSSYANYLVWKGWKGHIFAGRYKSICVDKEEYLLIVSRYIHLNPVEAVIVLKPEYYRWSSYVSHVDNKKGPAWLKSDWLLEHFGPGVDESRAKYKEFVEAGTGNPDDYPQNKVVAQAILGNEEFVKKIKSMLGKGAESDEVTGRRILLKRVTLEAIYREICNHYGFDNLKIADHNSTEKCRIARKLFIYLAREQTPSSNREIAEKIGDIGVSCASYHYKHTKGLLKKGQSQERLEREIKVILLNFKG